MDELIKALAEDVAIIERQQTKGEKTAEHILRGMHYAFKCALGRALMVSQEDDLWNVDKANRAAEEYLNER